jgi:hypothetical protein
MYALSPTGTVVPLRRSRMIAPWARYFVMLDVVINKPP